LTAQHDDHLVTVEAAARALPTVSEAALRGRIRRGELEVHRHRHRVFIPVRALREVLGPLVPPGAFARARVWTQRLPLCEPMRAGSRRRSRRNGCDD
jgi:hypothetical protein